MGKRKEVVDWSEFRQYRLQSLGKEMPQIYCTIPARSMAEANKRANKYFDEQKVPLEIRTYSLKALPT